ASRKEVKQPAFFPIPTAVDQRADITLRRRLKILHANQEREHEQRGSYWRQGRRTIFNTFLEAGKRAQRMSARIGVARTICPLKHS
ncbi:hypothetical protein, partial [Bradyrhizobium sp. AS23.2]|uniref:hypothetical protein n=1 Tax=Bradyrhizobium sp. AS23.2 TaxID=1680155 RepID=UPI0009622629